MLVKYIDKYNIKYANYKEILEYNEIQVINPRSQEFEEAGYKNLNIEEEPAFNPETQYLQPYYEELENMILQKWEVKEIAEGE